MPDHDRPKKPFRSGTSGPGKSGASGPGKPGKRPWRPEGPRAGGKATPWPRKDGPRKDGPHRDGPRGGRRGFRPEPRDRDGPAILYGWHTVKAALENPARRFLRLLATENAARRLADEGVPTPVAPELVRPEQIAAIVGPEAVHQGLLAEAEPLQSPDIEDLPAEGLILVLDQITDPHNVGAILRSAAAFAVAAVVTTARHSPEATGVLAKAASGALDIVPIVTVGNLSRALTTLKDNGWMTVGLDSEGTADLADTPLRGPLALVLGAEGKGLRQLTRTTCDAVARIDLPGQITSLNVSNATALALYVAHTRLKA
ncbi:23S rRNA (guanosine(2251)-2'-O)-methyltransferase RlmB, partial [Rhodoplanes sp. TEM]